MAQQQVFTVRVAQLPADKKNILMEHVAASPHYAVAHANAQYTYGDKVFVEVPVPAAILGTVMNAPLHVAPKHPNDASNKAPNSGRSAAASGGRNVSFADTSSSSSLPGAAKSDLLVPPERSCAWLHKSMDEIYTFRQKKAEFELKATLQPASGPVIAPYPTTNSTQSRRPLSPGTSSLSGSSTFHAPKTLAQLKPQIDDMSIAAFQYLTKTFGMPEMVKSHAAELLHALRYFRGKDMDAQLFGLLMSSQAYDSVDVQNTLMWRSILQPYLISKQEIVDGTPVTRKFVRTRDVPGLLRKCLIERPFDSIASSVSSSRELTRAQYPLQTATYWNRSDHLSLESVWNRCRAALPQWCNPKGCFPGIVTDPNFYCPPFRSTNPYVGKIGRYCRAAPIRTNENDSAESIIASSRDLRDAANETIPFQTAALAFEGRFVQFPPENIVHAAQLLMLMLLCSKQERLDPSEAQQRRVAAVSPVRTTPVRREAATVRTSRGKSRVKTVVDDGLRELKHQREVRSSTPPAAGHRQNPSKPSTPLTTPPSMRLPDEVSTATEGAVGVSKTPVTMLDVSPNLHPFRNEGSPLDQSPPLARLARRATVGGMSSLLSPQPHDRRQAALSTGLDVSPSLREEEANFTEEVKELEQRLVKTLRGGASRDAWH